MTDINNQDAAASDASTSSLAKGIRAFFWVSIGLLVAACAWLAYIAIQISGAASHYSAQTLALPTFAQYAKVAKLETIAPRRVGGVTPEEAARGASVQLIFDWVADFENGRAVSRIKQIAPVVSGVVASGIAERIGIRPGDEITTVQGAVVKSVYEVFEMLDQRPDQTARITIKRGGKLFSAVLTAPAGSLVNSETSGLLFEIPKGLNIVTKSQAAALASQFESRFVQLIPSEWRRQYLQNLAGLIIALQPYAEFQQELTAADTGFIRIDDMISWHHDTFTSALEKYTEESRQASVSQLMALGSFGDAMVGLLAALALFFFSLWLRSRYATSQAD